MSERIVTESLSVAHFPPWRLREHLLDVTQALADELLAAGDVDRITALAALYQTTVDALHRRVPQAPR